MTSNAEFVLAIGTCLLLGLAADAIGRRTIVPRVTLILLCGIAVGEEGFGFVPLALYGHFPLVTDLALMMVGFLLGGRLHISVFRADGRQVIWISVLAALGATVLVTIALMLLGFPVAPAILLGCIAAATLDTVLVYGGKAKFGRLRAEIVAIDDVWALSLFSISLAVVGLLAGDNHLAGTLIDVGYDLGGALLLGLTIGSGAALWWSGADPGGFLPHCLHDHGCGDWKPCRTP